jgi:hypothetical protein
MPTDKLLHFLAGCTIAALGYPFGIFWACLAVFAAAVGKEAYDSTGRGNVGPTAGPRGNLRDTQGNDIVFDPNGISNVTAP